MKLTFPQRLKAATAAITGHWEGGERSRARFRPAERLESQDSSLDLGTRGSMTSEARVLCQVFPVAVTILNKYANYVVGPCEYTWNTGNQEHDKAYEDYWRNWMKRCDASGRHSFPALSRLAVMSAKRDGAIFGNFVSGGVTNRDVLIRMVESDRVGNYRGGSINIDQKKTDFQPEIVAGCVIRNGRTVEYIVNDRGSHGNFVNPRHIPASSMVHYFNTSRVDAVTGITAFHAVLNHLRDLKEMIDANKSKVKLNSKLALLVKTVAGAAASGQGGLTLFENPDGSQASAASVNAQEVGDAAMAYMFPNEDMKAHENNQPSGEVMAFLQFIVHNIAVGMNLPFGVVWSMSGLTGPGVRYDINSADRTFINEMDIFEEKFANPIVARVTANAMERGLLPQNPNWFEFSRRRPARAGIDLGREVQAGMSEYDNLLTAGTDWVAEEGKSYAQVIDQIFKEEAMKLEAAKKYGVPYVARTVANLKNVDTNGNTISQPAKAA